VDVALMIEGQDGLDWPRWQALARVAEEGGFAGLFRSDHFVNKEGPPLAALDLWASLGWLASHTQPDRVRAARVARLLPPPGYHRLDRRRRRRPLRRPSAARARAGWQEREHAAFGFDLLDTDRRFARFAEGLEVVTRLLRGDGPVSFQGEFYRLQEAELLPRPVRPGGPPIVIGGNGRRRTLPLAARFADEWNGVFLTPEQFAEASGALDRLVAEVGRSTGAVRRTLMTRVVFGRDRAAAVAKLGDGDVAALEARGAVVGGPDEVRERLAAFCRRGGRAADAAVGRRPGRPGGDRGAGADVAG
jgi:alkanesulfonate monooxygenase SsuD/methylene tetrahydromethanopterin reductase-like flavin-dependent oxidoreductase (luciferase family)